MGPTNSRPAELALPVASLAALRRALAGAVGADGAARALQAAGHAAGDAFFRDLCRAPGHSARAPGDEDAHSLRQLPQEVFWRRFAHLFASRGWGTLGHEPAHPGVGGLRSSDWVEADPAIDAVRPSCFFSTGLLANLLGHVAGEEIAIIEVECRSQGDAQCRFLFGAPAALDRVFERLREDGDVAASIAALA